MRLVAEDLCTLPACLEAEAVPRHLTSNKADMGVQERTLWLISRRGMETAPIDEGKQAEG